MIILSKKIRGILFRNNSFVNSYSQKLLELTIKKGQKGQQRSILFSFVCSSYEWFERPQHRQPLRNSCIHNILHVYKESWRTYVPLCLCTCSVVWVPLQEVGPTIPQHIVPSVTGVGNILVLCITLSLFTEYRY